MFHIVEGKHRGGKVYQVFMGQKTMGDPHKSRELAEGAIKLLEAKIAQGEAERAAETKTP